MVNKNIRITKLPHRGKNQNFFQTLPSQKTSLVKNPPPTKPFPLHFLPNPKRPTTSHTRNFMLYTSASHGKIDPHYEGSGQSPSKRSVNSTARNRSNHPPRYPPPSSATIQQQHGATIANCTVQHGVFQHGTRTVGGLPPKGSAPTRLPGTIRNRPNPSPVLVQS